MYWKRDGVSVVYGVTDLLVAVPSCYGCHRIWRMTIPTTWRCKQIPHIAVLRGWSYFGSERRMAYRDRRNVYF